MNGGQDGRADILRIHGWAPHDKTTGRKALALGNQGSGGNDGAGSYPYPREDDGPHAYQAIIPDDASVEDCPVADRAIFSDKAGLPWVGMDDYPILDITSRANLYGRFIAPKGGREPNGRILPQLNLTGNFAIPGGKAGGGYLGPLLPNAVNHGVFIR